MKFNSIRFKISVFYTAILALILVFYTAINYYNLRYALYRDLDNDALVKAQEVSNTINSFLVPLGNDQRAFDFAARRVIRLEGAHPGQARIEQMERQWLQKREQDKIADAYINLATADRAEPVVVSANMNEKMVKGFLSDFASSSKKTLSYKDVVAGSTELRVVTIPFYYTFKKKQTYLLQVGVSRRPVLNILYGRLIFAALTIPLILLIASFFGGVITDRVLKPIMKLTGVASNITHKDLSIRVPEERVEEELKYLVNAFNEMISRLDKSFRYIAEFSSNVAHELKTPLTIIKGESEVTLMQERDPAEYRRVIKVTLEETEGMLAIVEDLLLLSRLEYQPGAFHFEPFDFNGLIDDVFEQAKKIAAAKNITVKLSRPERPLVLRADATHLRRLFLNLVSNAVKFSRRAGDIAIKAQAEGKTLVVSVADNGVGIKPGDINKVFDRFFHVDHPGPGGSSGTGLGLSIAQSIARIHRGDITVASQPDKGSTFTVTLPL
ncbi:MAG: HAMP domain-containing sensor histidine kinase [Candidatus Omnitrophica bacterium]|nr:HAMP domain-containing sensor histidine kinase [Candidatus Omnitrophota bacterium]